MNRFSSSALNAIAYWWPYVFLALFAFAIVFPRIFAYFVVQPLCYAIRAIRGMHQPIVSARDAEKLILDIYRRLHPDATFFAKTQFGIRRYVITALSKEVHWLPRRVHSVDIYTGEQTFIGM